MLTMQDALLALARYWGEQGCLTVQPTNTEVGAGTLNPATFLRVLGPEPWRVAYVEPSVRPDDARYGENPNRIQTYHQFQVILKPEPGDPQQLYLGSLAALGIDIAAHDVRFVEDNWTSPALGAWGLGWEVWLDGLEITQFTYFQQAGGLNLDPIPVEITYGIERILMALQGVAHFKDIVYAEGITYGEIFGQAEYEMSRYYLDDADVDTNRQLFELYAAEARRMVDANLPVPAHAYVLKCSHAFNVLDSRKAVSPTERARAFGRMRRLAAEVAAAWVARRAEIGHPLGTTTPPAGPEVSGRPPAPEGNETFTIEIGVEELPPSDVATGATALATALTTALAAARLGHGTVTTYAGPRRLAVSVADVEPRQEDVDVETRGPRVSAAFDAEGQPTKAALGFARGRGVAVEDLGRVEVGGVEHLSLTQHVPGRPAGEVLAELLPGVVSGLQSEKNMRWNAPGVSYARPIRRIVALLGTDVVPFTAASLASGRQTTVRGDGRPTTVDIPAAAGYAATLEAHGVVADPAQRRALVVAGATRLAREAGGTVDPDAEAGLVDEITGMVEAPTPILGSFDPRYLDLPADVLTTVMGKHQRYLPVRDTAGALLPRFVTMADGQCDPDVVRAGNEAVLRARYEDASFFWRADLTVPPKDFRARIAQLTYVDRLGTMADRADRVAALAARLAGRVALTDADAATLHRAAPLVKFDLAAQMVIELSSLAGVMAREYAARAGEPAAVATALFEAELPRQAGDRLPETVPGVLLSLADRFDMLAGLFAVGATPTGSSDPLGLRRSALGLVNVLRAHPAFVEVTVAEGLRLAADLQPVRGEEAVLADAAEFVVRRYEQQARDAGHDHRLVQAVLPLAGAPARADRALAELERRVDDPAFADLVRTLQRVGRIVPAGRVEPYDPARLTEPAEVALHEAVTAAAAAYGGGPPDLARLAEAAAGLPGPVDTFFVDVLVMAPEPEVRANRLGLLAAVRDLGAGIDWQQLR